MPIKLEFGSFQKWMPPTFQRGAKVEQPRLIILKCSVKPTTGRKEINRNYLDVLIMLSSLLRRLQGVTSKATAREKKIFKLILSSPRSII